MNSFEKKRIFQISKVLHYWLAGCLLILHPSWGWWWNLNMRWVGYHKHFSFIPEFRSTCIYTEMIAMHMVSIWSMDYQYTRHTWGWNFVQRSIAFPTMVSRVSSSSVILQYLLWQWIQCILRLDVLMSINEAYCNSVTDMDSPGASIKSQLSGCTSLQHC